MQRVIINNTIFESILLIRFLTTVLASLHQLTLKKTLTINAQVVLLVRHTPFSL